MGAQERVVMESDISAAVLGKSGEFILVDLSGEIDAAMETARARGFTYCGVLAVANGQATARPELDPDSTLTMLHASLAFAQMVADRLRPPQPKDDFVEFAESLWSMEDPRSEA